MDFNNWLINYKNMLSIKEFQKTVDQAFKNTKLLKRIIKYDRNQPEFIEKTNVYIGKELISKRLLR